ncbi:DUF6894 family protein [Sphingomonas sp. R86520]|jgi:hypothetical protein|uniref:DUF6894 family protein n=1 Tax=Sphingomonas sp. R86520 TaxID=3093859 RepID=UPI0036D41C27
MPRYFFDMANSTRDIDEEGTELASADDARVQAVVFAGDYLRDQPGLVWDGGQFAVAVRDEAGRVLLNVVVTATDPADSSL